MSRTSKHPHDKKLRVQQHHAVGNSAEDIMRKHVKGPNRMLPPGNPGATRQPEFRYMPSQSYHDMLNTVREIDAKFYALPSRVRQRFSNSPEFMLRFMENPSNRMECVRLGLVAPSDAEFDQLSQEAETRRLQNLQKAQEAAGQQIIVPRPDPEAHPDYGRRSPPRAQDTPPKGGAGGQ